MNNNSAFYGVKILSELIRDIIYFPLWWYTQGLILFFESLIHFLKEKQKGLGILVWSKNIFRPMYGQQDWQGTLISFFMRLIQIIFRCIVMIFFIIISIIFFSVWVVAPIFVIYQIIFQLI